jgi:hypothetical protein
MGHKPHSTVVPNEGRATNVEGVENVLGVMGDDRVKRAFAETYRLVHHVKNGQAGLVRRAYLNALAEELQDRGISGEAALRQHRVEVVE